MTESLSGADAPRLIMKHHPSSVLLTAYAAGTLTQAPSLLVATHITFCTNCRSAVTDMEALGGALVESLEPVALAEDALDAVLARLDQPVAPTVIQAAVAPVGEAALLPAPVRAFLPALVKGRLPWRRMGPGIRHLPLIGRQADGTSARLLAVDPRTPLPEHGHGGNEYTIVLQGGFADETGTYTQGDVAELDENVTHRPVVGNEPCLCLVVTGAPLRFTQALPRLLQPLFGL